MKTLYEYTIKSRKTDFKSVQIMGAQDAYACAIPMYEDRMGVQERVYAIFLNTSNRTVGFMEVSFGGRSSSVIDNMLIIKTAVDTLATGVILFHNHPSGNATPSAADRKMTKKLKDALELLEVRLVDHIIVTDNNEMYSFAEEKVMQAAYPTSSQPQELNTIAAETI